MQGLKINQIENLRIKIRVLTCLGGRLLADLAPS